MYFRPLRSDSSGFSLIEVLVSLLIISITLLGLTALMTNALRYSYDAYLESVAVNQLSSMAERLRATHGDALGAVVADWNQENQQALPQGQGDVAPSNGTYTLALGWQARHKASAVGDCRTSKEHACLTMRVQL